MGIERKRNVTITIDAVTINSMLVRSKLPMPIPRGIMKEYIMSEGSSGPGIRVLDPLGVHVSYTDFEFEGQLITASDLSLLQGYWLDYRRPKTLTITEVDISTDVYKFLFAEDGFLPDLQSAAVDYSEDKYRCKFKLKILNKVA